PASCFLDTVDGGYDVPVPDHIPAAPKAVFAWSWISAMGAREYYMNCADVRIENFGKQEPLVAHELLVVNVPGRPTLAPRTGREEDKLPQMMQQRSFVSVGKPMDLVAADEAAGRPRSSASDDAAEQQEPGEPDPAANRAATGEDDNTLADEITSYVYTTHTVTEDDDDGDGANLDGSFAYSELDDYRRRTKPAGLVVLSDDDVPGSRKKPSVFDASIPFDVDDTLPLVTPHMTGNDNFDFWPASSASTLATVDIAAATGATVSPASLVTQFKTVTISNTPFLQVVVSSNNTAIPSSLTIAY
ncbi:hypothetical protein IW150_006510, partial [Coemansia sp. RSA 2607]